MYLAMSLVANCQIQLVGRKKSSHFILIGIFNQTPVRLYLLIVGFICLKLITSITSCNEAHHLWLKNIKKATVDRVIDIISSLLVTIFNI
jgi:hypothetical protein